MAPITTRQAEQKHEHQHRHEHHITVTVERDPWLRRLCFILIVIALLFFLRSHGWAQSSTPGADTYDRSNKAVRVTVVAGGGTGGGPTDVAPNTAASETDVGRQKVTSFLRLLDTSQIAGSQGVTAKGDQTSGMWVNCKAGCSGAADTTASGTLGALNNAVSVALAGETSAGFVLSSGNTLVGTITPEVSFDGGTTWVAGYLRQDGTNAWVPTLSASSTAASYHLFIPGGASNARVRVSAYTSGTATGAVRAVSQPESLPFWAGIGGSTAPLYTLLMGGSDGTNLRALKTDTSGDLNVIFPSAQHTIIDSATLGTVTVTGTVTANAGTGNFNNASVGTNGSAAPGSSTQVGGTDGINLQPLYLDPCQRGAKTYTAISLTANTQIITGTSSKKTYVCEMHLIAAAATNVALVEGTGTVCATGIAGMAGGSTAATGWNLAANGGLVLGSGGFAVAVTATAADNVCILVSAANQVSGNIVTVQY